MRFTIFFVVITVILSLASFYVGTRLMRSDWLYSHRRVVWMFLFLFIALQLLGPILYRAFPDHFSNFFALHWITYTTLGLFASLFFYTVFADALLLIWSFLNNGKDSVDLERRNVLLVGSLTLGTTVLGLAQTSKGPQLEEVDIPIRNLPEAFQGFRIAQVSDLHVGPLIRRDYVQNVVKMVSEAKPDLIALTGDFSDGTVGHLRDEIWPLEQLQAPHGKFFVTGNHEYYWEANEWLKLHREMGARILENEHVVLEKDGKQLVLAGVNDLSHESDPKAAAQGAPSGVPRILLAHQPASYKAASEAGFDLQLSGHTHAGQFFPWNLVVKVAQKYYRGLNRHENMWVYVNRGTGYWGPPIRFAVPSEITLIRLVKG
jgi:predicted MPP superfamily phosphohydrolase